MSDSPPTKGDQELAVLNRLNWASEELDCQDNQYLYRRCQSYILNILQVLDPKRLQQRSPRQLACC